jgi:hypothetical protein
MQHGDVDEKLRGEKTGAAAEHERHMTRTSSWASLSAPASISNRTQSAQPQKVAEISAVNPLCELDPPPHTQRHHHNTRNTKILQMQSILS